MALTPGSTFAGYTVLGRLGAGGMGQVYLVENLALQRREALKVLDAAVGQSTDFAERFAREARTAAALRHPSIITVHAYGVEDGDPWFTMSHLDGHDLTAARLSDVDLAEVARQTASALDYAHRNGVIHRDIKPANIVLTRDAHDARLESVTVLDFGIARLADATGLTGTGMLLGTVAYTAPEIIEGHPPSAATDQHSLACTLYELLTGTPPFRGDSPLAVMRAHADDPAPLISGRRPDLTVLDPVFARALAKNPADRYPSCRDLADAVSAGLTTAGRTTVALTTAAPAGAGPPNRFHHPLPGPPGLFVPPGPPGNDHRSKKWLLAGGAVAAVVVLLAAAAGAYLLFRGSDGTASVEPLNNAVIAPSSYVSCAIAGTAATGGDLSCWGSNSSGQLATGDDEQHGYSPVRIAGLRNVTAVSVDPYGTTCAISVGDLYCWGQNTSGQVGDGSAGGERLTPVRVAGLSGVTAVSAAFESTCAVASGDLYCWGKNDAGQLGDGTTADRATPTPVRGVSEVTAVSTAKTTCAVTRGLVYCWGASRFGQLGEDVRTDSPLPVKIDGVSDVVAVTSGGQTTCALSGGAAYCWGSNNIDPLDDARRDPELAAPTRLPWFSRVSAISSSFRSTCVVDDGKVYCWGENADGQVGNGSTADQNEPFEVAGLPKVSALVMQWKATCAVSDGTVFCWGANAGSAPGNEKTVPTEMALG